MLFDLPIATTQVVSPVIINAGGPHSSKITALAFRDAAIINDMNVHTRPLKQEVASVQVHGEDQRAASVIAADFDSGVYFRSVD